MSQPEATRSYILDDLSRDEALTVLSTRLRNHLSNTRTLVSQMERLLERLEHDEIYLDPFDEAMSDHAAKLAEAASIVTSADYKRYLRLQVGAQEPRSPS